MVEQLVQHVGVIFLSLQKVKKHPRIKVSAARSHHDTADGSESHCRLDRGAVANSRNAAAIAEMSDHHTRRQCIAQNVHDGFAGEAVKAVAPQSLFPKLTPERQSSCILGQRAMKNGIEAGDLWDVGIVTNRLPQDIESRDQMQRREGDSLFDLSQDVTRDPLMFLQI